MNIKSLKEITEHNKTLQPLKHEQIDEHFSVQYTRYVFDDFIILIKKHYDFEEQGLYQVIYEDAYGDFNGTILNKNTIKEIYNIEL